MQNEVLQVLGREGRDANLLYHLLDMIFLGLSDVVEVLAASLALLCGQLLNGISKKEDQPCARLLYSEILIGMT